MIKVVIVDGIWVLRQGLKAILKRDSDIQMTGLAADGREAWQPRREVKPDVVLMDTCMSQYDESYGITKIKEGFPDIRVLVLTTFNNGETANAAVCNGADGYILKEMEDDKVIQLVKAVCAGIRVFGGSTFEDMRRQMAPSGFRPDQAVNLTPREWDIMRPVAQDMDNREIAAEFLLAKGTVHSNISHLLEEPKLKGRTQPAAFVMKNNLGQIAFPYTMSSGQNYGRDDP